MAVRVGTIALDALDVDARLDRAEPVVPPVVINLLPVAAAQQVGQRAAYRGLDSEHAG